MSGTNVRYEIIPASIDHVYELAANLREGDRNEIESAGLDPRHCLRDTFKSAIIRKTALVDGKVACMFGLGGDLLSNTGKPWLLTSPVIETISVSFVREARKELAAMLAIRSHLQNWVAADYGRAIRFLEVLGFTVHEPAPFGPKDALFRMFERNA